MKKLLSVFLIISILLSFGAYATDKAVKIEFCVGDSTLLINDQPVTVETAPYVVGVGVTLVPVRVITEAFGATVGWEESTQTVSLAYPDIDIILQIGNPIAEVNGKAEELLSAPELKNGRTMIPLRFISENFGASVSYDDATERITVIKESGVGSSSIVESGVTNKKIGDSFYGWSMNNPVDMQMDYRSFDGLDTTFTYDDDNYFHIDIDMVGEKYDFDKDFINLKSALEGYTLVKAETDVSDPSKKIIYLQAKDKNHFINITCFATDTYYYTLYGVFSNETTALRDSFVECMSTFDTVYAGGDIYDLSNVKNGVRKFESALLNFSFEIPADFYMTSDEEAENEFRFNCFSKDDKISSASVSAYSKSSVTSAKAMAENDRELNRKTINDQISNYGVVQSVKYNSFSGYMYTGEINLSTGSEVSKDVFFECGDYVYNIHVASKYPHRDGDSSAFIDKILNSVNVGKIDSSKVGTLLRNMRKSTGSLTHTVDNVSFKYPNSYEVVDGDDGLVGFYNPNTANLLTYDKDPNADIDFQDASIVMNRVKKTVLSEGATVIENTNERLIHGSAYVTLTVSKKTDAGLVYTCYYMTVRKKTAYIFKALYPELTYSSNNRKEIEAIIGTMNVKSAY